MSGKDKQHGGRSGEAPSIGISESLKSLGIELRRLKTGTPPRLLKRSIDFSRLEAQGGDTPIPYFSQWPLEEFHVEQTADNPSPINATNAGKVFPKGSILEKVGGQLNCYLTKTTTRTKEIVRDNLHLSPMCSGEIEGVGPRYCPSIEDKMVKFAEKDTHQVFLEPEGIATDEIYINGLSTCLPFEVQIQLVRSVVGCENAEIIRPAYAVEYDYSPPTQVSPTLETKACEGLFLAGQINGTSGYEEAAAQGLMAGINAARKCQGKAPIVLGRNQAYIGVLIDDLVNLGTTEPYRMFTSRSEFRLLLRHDNADTRLSAIGHEIGLLPSRHFSLFTTKRNQIDEEVRRLETTRVGRDTLAQMLRRPEVTYDQLPDQNKSLPMPVKESVEIEIKYEGYINRQLVDVERSEKTNSKTFPEKFDYMSVTGLSREAKQKLATIRPLTLGQASRISGVSPADIGLLAVWIKRFPTTGKPQSPAEDCFSGCNNPSQDVEQ